MTLEIACPGCGRLLRVGQQHAGKQIRCPACQQISVAPDAIGAAAVSPPAAADAAPNEPATWYLKTPEGPIYGPIAWSEMRHWADEGRIDRDCLLAETSQGPWQSAADVLPALPADRVPPRAAERAPHSAGPGSISAPGPAGWPAAGPAAFPIEGAAPGGWIAPHRGGLIFLLGLLGFAVACPLFSFLAWVMGSRDLAEMRARRMDRSGEGLTMGGMILGIVVSVFWIVVLFGIMTILLLVAALRL
jgi:ribosomal protein S27E